MDVFSDPSIHTVVVMSSAQIGKTTILENVVGYYIDQDSSPQLIMQPTLEMAKAFSKDRLAPMLRDTPCLQEKIGSPKAKESGNEILHKTYVGGHVTLAGANSPATMAQRPVRIAIGDDVDRFPPSAGTEGDPLDLLFKRTTAFWNRKKGVFSTPTIKNFSRIEKAYEGSDMRRFWVPCLHCEEFQILSWKQVRWSTIGRKPENAGYFCKHCNKEITHADKIRMVRKGEWRAESESKGVVGFWINELYSPFVSFSEMAVSFVKAKREGPEALKVFINTSLAETWEEKGESIKDGTLLGRREKYGHKIPVPVGLLTVSVDVQGGGAMGGRLELELIGWGKGYESWGIEYKVFYGDPIRPEVWKELDEYLRQSWEHESGTMLRIAGCLIDAGYAQKQVFDFCRPRTHMRVLPSKGMSTAGKPLATMSILKANKIRLVQIGTDTAKDIILGRLKIENPGAGYMHFPVEYDALYFQMLTAEKATTKYSYGVPVRRWELKSSGARNEALDIRVMSLACVEVLRPNLDKLVDSLRIGRDGDAAAKAKPTKTKKGRKVFSQGIRI